MDDPVSIIGGVFVGLGLIGIFLMSLSEASLLSVSQVSMRRLAEQGDRRAALILQMRESNDYLSAIIVGINFCVILVATLVTVILHRQLGAGTELQEEAWQIATLVVILVLCELTPKTWGSLMSEPVALFVVPGVHMLTRVTAPALRALTWVSNIVLWFTGGEPSHRRHFVTAADIQVAADIGEEEGVFEAHEGELLDSVIQLDETTARDIMVPRVDMVTLDAGATTAEAVKTITETGFSRIPVYEESPDTIVGVLYAKDLLQALENGNRDLELMELVRECYFVPEAKSVRKLFTEMRDNIVHIAIVVDEFGGTEGLVTIEDILEEVVGEIEDEYDVPAQDLVMISSTEAVADARCTIGDINDNLDVQIAGDEHETVGGYVASRLGRIPQIGAEIDEDSVRLTVEQGTDQYVERVRITRLDSEGESARGKEVEGDKEQ